MPTTQEHSLNYQPDTEPYSYAPFKMSILKRVLIALPKLSPFIFAFLVIFAAIIIIINYFNILSLSYFYPQVFGNLPHRYNFVVNQSSLSDVKYSSDNKSYILEGILYKINGETVSIEYKGKIVEFLMAPEITCYRITTRIVLQNVKIIDYELANCSDILINKNSGKKISVNYFRDSLGYFIINYITLE